MSKTRLQLLSPPKGQRDIPLGKAREVPPPLFLVPPEVSPTQQEQELTPPYFQNTGGRTGMIRPERFIADFLALIEGGFVLERDFYVWTELNVHDETGDCSTIYYLCSAAYAEQNNIVHQARQGLGRILEPVMEEEEDEAAEDVA